MIKSLTTILSEAPYLFKVASHNWYGITLFNTFHSLLNKTLVLGSTSSTW